MTLVLILLGPVFSLSLQWGLALLVSVKDSEQCLATVTISKHTGPTDRTPGTFFTLLFLRPLQSAPTGPGFSGCAVSPAPATPSLEVCSATSPRPPPHPPGIIVTVKAGIGSWLPGPHLLQSKAKDSLNLAFSPEGPLNSPDEHMPSVKP